MQKVKKQIQCYYFKQICGIWILLNGKANWGHLDKNYSTAFVLTVGFQKSSKIKTLLVFRIEGQEGAANSSLNNPFKRNLKIAFCYASWREISICYHEKA